MDIICIGLVVCDIMAKPVSMEVMNKDVSLVDYMAMSNGGDAMNVAFNLASMGINTGLAGRIGKDKFGEFLMEIASKKGLNTAGIVIDDNRGTAVCINLIRDDGERNFVYYSGAGASLCEADIDMELVKQAKILTVGGAGLLPGLDGNGLANVLKKAQELGVKTCVDISGDLDDAFKEKARQFLKYTDIFLPSDYQASFITGKQEPAEIAKELLELGPEIVGIKLGSKGSFLASKKETVCIPAFEVEAVDTTGAGDAFVAGFLASYLKGLSLYECGRFANAAGALCVTGMGATAGARPYAEIMDFINNNK